MKCLSLSYCIKLYINLKNGSIFVKKNYKICSKVIQLEAPCFPCDYKACEQFEISNCQPDITIDCVVGDSLPAHSGKFVSRAGDTYVYADDEFVYRSSQMGTADGALTVYRQNDTSRSTTYFTKKSFNVMMDSDYIWNSVSIAQLMLPFKTVFIHSSYIDYSDKAILFSAPSGTGKSTQAALWKKNENADIINGDKAGISLVDGVVCACGVPFSGTSGICKNRIIPLGAIVLLYQSGHNIVRKLTGIEALQAVMKNIHLDLIAPREQQLCVDLLIDVISDVPVYEFGCTPDEQAVRVLKETLLNGGVL